MIKKTVLNRDKLLKVLRRRKTALSTKELAKKAGVNPNSARRDISRLYYDFMVDKVLHESGCGVAWRLGIVYN